MADRKWLPNFAELIDRLSIHQLKEVFLTDEKDKYKREMREIMHDLDLIISEENVTLSSDMIRAIIVISQINTHIWYNESKARRGEEQDLKLLKLTHGLNGIRNRAINHILSAIGQEHHQNHKTDCLAAEFNEWEISLGSDNKTDN